MKIRPGVTSTRTDSQAGACTIDTTQAYYTIVAPVFQPGYILYPFLRILKKGSDIQWSKRLMNIIFI